MRHNPLMNDTPSTSPTHGSKYSNEPKFTGSSSIDADKFYGNPAPESTRSWDFAKWGQQAMSGLRSRPKLFGIAAAAIVGAGVAYFIHRHAGVENRAGDQDL